MDFTTLTIVIQLIVLEGVLSIDNAAVLGAMVRHLPDDKVIPWPSWVPWGTRWRGRMGSQRESALKIGLVGAYAGRALMLLLAGAIIQIQWVRVVGAAYLLYLGINHVASMYRSTDTNEGKGHATAQENGFWVTVGATILADLAFSIDNVIAAVALSDKLWVVLLGVAIGMVIMRFAAGLFSRAINWEPALETGAYLLLLAIGAELLLKEYLHIHIDEYLQFGISAGILALTVVFSRSPLLRNALIVFRPVIALFAALQWFVDQTFALALAPIRRFLPSEKL